MKQLYNIVVILLIGLASILGFQEITHANSDSHELLVEYEENRQTLSVEEDIPGVESRETIADQVELWSFTDEVRMKTMEEQLLDDPNVLHVEPNYERYTHEVTFNDVDIAQQWWVPQVKPQSMWSRFHKQQKDVVVAVIDSGVDVHHEDLQGRIHLDGYSFYDNNSNIQDVNGHGTAIAGVIAATSGNSVGGVGIAGQYNVQVLPLKVFHKNGTSKLSNGIKAINYAVEKKVDVINLSYGSSRDSKLEEEAIERAIAAGITVVASAGNDGEKGNSEMYPASYPSVISVGASNQMNQRAPFSNYNKYVSLVAPGTAIYTTTINNSYKLVNGTSFSGPMVAGAAALVKSLQPQATPQEVRALLEMTATDLGEPGKDIHFGAGLLNLEKLQRAIPMNQPSKFIGDFPELTVKSDKVFKISFNDELALGEQYNQNIHITNTPDSNEKLEDFDVFVNPEDNKQLLVKPKKGWSEGIHYLRVDKILRNKNGISLKKTFAIKFTVVSD